MTSNKNYSMELLFKALADRTRLRLLNLIGDDEVCVCFFVEVLGTNKKSSRIWLTEKGRGCFGTPRGQWIPIGCQASDD